MFYDLGVTFVPPGAPLSLVSAAGVSIPSGIVDLLGEGVGVAPSQSIIGQATTFGQPAAMGLGRIRPELFCSIGVGLVTANGATLNLALQAAADTGAAGGYQPSTWNTLIETGALTAAELIAGTIFARFPWVPPFPANLRPRFMRLLAQIPAAENFTSGTIAVATTVLDRNDSFNKYAYNNYKVG
jgi:hypothetical protein